MTFVKGHKLGVRFQKGQVPWNKGVSNTWYNPSGLILGHGWNKGKKLKPHSEETRLKMRMSAKRGEQNHRWIGGAKQCIECGVKIASRSISVKRCSKCFHLTQVGENNSNWKGGVTKIAEKIRKSGAYSEWRRSILCRDNFVCLLCEKRGGKLNVDHYPKTFSEIMNEKKIDSIERALNCKELWDTSNGRTLCLECHKLTPTYLSNYKKINV